MARYSDNRRPSETGQPVDMIDVAIIGAGTGGLSLARLLADRGVSATVFEASSLVGGKAESVHDYGTAIEMGTCYTTLSHSTAKRWMRGLGIALMRNGTARYDGRNFKQYVEEGEGPPFLFQMLSYLKHSWSLKNRLAKTPNDPEVLEEASLTILDWLRARDLPKMELFLHRIQTVMGYGFLDETTAVQAQHWCNASLIISGFLNQLHMPVEGWSEFWRRLALDLDVRTNCPVHRVERQPDYVELHTEQGVFKAGQVVSSIGMVDFGKIADLTDAEARVNEGVEWGGYTTTLVSVKDWYTDFQINGYSEAVKPGADLGQMVGARYEVSDPELGALYVTGQIPGSYPDPELAEMLCNDIKKHGGSDPHIVRQHTWRYFPRLKQEAVRSGIVQHMIDMQGANRTWHTGATFSFEAVSHIVALNEKLAPQIEATLKADALATAA